MKVISLLFACLSYLGMEAQSYSISYSGKGYPQPQYRLERNYLLSVYQENEADLLCLTCNHCQIPAVSFNPSFPIMLLGFKAKRRSPEVVELRWNWTSEKKSLGGALLFRAAAEDTFYVVQRWKDFMPKEFIHQNNFTHPTWYQLIFVEPDGRQHQSKIREVIGAKTLRGMVIFPNPSNQEVFIKPYGLKRGNYQLLLLDISGRKLANKHLDLFGDENAIKIPGTTGLTKGIYVVEFRSASGVFREKFVFN